MTGGAPPDAQAQQAAGAVPPASLVRLRPSGGFDVVADIAAYRQTDVDPDDLEDFADESNPHGLALIGGGKALVVDAANNDLLLVDLKTGAITTVTRFRTELVPWPADLPFGPPPATPWPVESVPTSVAVGPDGAYYVTELEGFPFVEGRSRGLRGVEIFGAPQIGALYAVTRGTKTELVPGQLLAPGGVAAADGGLYVTTGTFFGEDAGSVVRVSP